MIPAACAQVNDCASESAPTEAAAGGDGDGGGGWSLMQDFLTTEEATEAGGWLFRYSPAAAAAAASTPTAAVPTVDALPPTAGAPPPGSWSATSSVSPPAAATPAWALWRAVLRLLEASDEDKSSGLETSSGVDTLWRTVEAVPLLEHEIYSDTKIGDFDLLQHLGEGR